MVHVGEIANLLEDFLPLQEAAGLESALPTMENIEVIGISEELYLDALSVALEHNFGLNDSPVLVAMEKERTSEIYSFDGDFDKVKHIRWITK